MKKIKGYHCHESGLKCVKVVWSIFGLVFWVRDFGPAYPETIYRAVHAKLFNAETDRIEERDSVKSMVENDGGKL